MTPAMTRSIRDSGAGEADVAEHFVEAHGVAQARPGFDVDEQNGADAERGGEECDDDPVHQCTHQALVTLMREARRRAESLAGDGLTEKLVEAFG